MYGLVAFCLVTSWLFFIEGYVPELALYRGCSYSFWIFLGSAFFYSYKILVNQFSRILAYRKINEAQGKWNHENTNDVMGSIVYIILYWIQLALVMWPIVSSSENFILAIGGFISTSLIIVQLQHYIILNGVISSVRVTNRNV